MGKFIYHCYKLRKNGVRGKKQCIESFTTAIQVGSNVLEKKNNV
jgi:hypothetical protein